MPFEYFLYDGWPSQQNMRVYHLIADAEIVIRERESEASAHFGAREVVGGWSLTEK